MVCGHKVRLLGFLRVLEILSTETLPYVPAKEIFGKLLQLISHFINTVYVLTQLHETATLLIMSSKLIIISFVEK